MPNYKEAPQRLINLAQKVIREHHEKRELQDARIGFTIREGDPPQGVWAKAIKVTDHMQMFMEYDFIIWVSSLAGAHEDEQLEALLDHVLSQCDFTAGNARLRKPDIQEFSEVVKRRGLWNVPLLRMSRAIEEYKQLAFQGLGDKIDKAAARGKVESVTISGAGKHVTLDGPIVLHPGMKKGSPSGS